MKTSQTTRHIISSIPEDANKRAELTFKCIRNMINHWMNLTMLKIRPRHLGTLWNLIYQRASFGIDGVIVSSMSIEKEIFMRVRIY